MTLVDEEQQSDYVIGRILEHHEAGIPLKKQAVLFRAAHHSDALEVELARRNIPFVKYGGLKFLEAAHVKDVLSILRLAENPRDTTSALPRAATARRRRPGPRQAGDRAPGGAPVRLQDAGTTSHPPPRRRGQWPAFVALLRELAPNDHAAAGAGRGRAGSSTRRSWRSGTTSRTSARATSSSSSRSPATSASRAQMLTDLTLDPPSAARRISPGPPLLEEDYLILSTIHSAKGCEWDAVYVIHAADGNIPSDMATGTRGGDRGGTPAVLRRADAGEGLPRGLLPAEVLRQEVVDGRPPPLAQLTRFSARVAASTTSSASRSSPTAPPTRRRRRPGVRRHPQEDRGDVGLINALPGERPSGPTLPPREGLSARSRRTALPTSAPASGRGSSGRSAPRSRPCRRTARRGPPR